MNKGMKLSKLTQALVGILVVICGLSASTALANGNNSGKGQHNGNQCLHGRMTGGGLIIFENGQRVTHGFELYCSAQLGPNSLEVNWNGNGFHLLNVDFAYCEDDPDIDSGNPDSPIDTLYLAGTGRLHLHTANGLVTYENATIEILFTDAGEPGRNDEAQFRIRTAAGGEVVLEGGGRLEGGNHQAHRLTGNKLTSK